MSKSDSDIPSTEALFLLGAHDLKAPLRTMHAFAEALEEDYAASLDDAAREYIGYITKGATDMRALIDGMLVFARLGQNGIAPRDVGIEDVIFGVRAEMRETLESAHADIQIGALPTLVTDPKILSALITQVLKNALVFRAEAQSPAITISAEHTDDAVRIKIADDGIGVPEDQWARVFDPFVRLNTDPAYAGAGLGLATAKKAAALLGGTIALQSVPGQGTEVAITLPRVNP